MSKERDLSTRQRNTLSFIVNHINHFHFPPSLREINEAVGGISTSGPSVNLDRLEEMGFIDRPKGDISRGIRVTLCPTPISLEDPCSELYDSQSLQDSEETKSSVEQEGGADHNGSKK